MAIPATGIAALTRLACPIVRPLQAEEVIEVQAGTARKGLCLQCSLNGFCEEGAPP